MEPNNITRRDFLKTVGLAGILSGCSSFDPHTLKDSQSFDTAKFYDWYVRKTLYNGRNPNLRSHDETLTFRDSITGGYTPGISYSVKRGEYMTAVADGSYAGAFELWERPGRLPGLMVTVRHPAEGDFAYNSSYAHLDDCLLKNGQLVRRGDKIGRVYTYYYSPKLILKEGLSGRLVDPDNYGENHSLMKYWDGSAKLEVNNPIDKLTKQAEILQELKENYTGEDKDTLFDITSNFFIHSRDSTTGYRWSNVEQFRYLRMLHEIRPSLFERLPTNTFQQLVKQFYDNQPIILTLPFKKT